MKSLLALCLLSGFALAQESTPQEEPVDGLLRRADPADENSRAARIFGRGFYVGEEDLDDGGDLAIKGWGIGSWQRWPLMGGNGAFGIGIEHTKTEYDFGGGAQLGGFVDPFDRVDDFRFTGSYEALIDSEWAWFTAGTVALGAGNDADLDDGFYAEGMGGFKFQVQDNLQIGLEVIVFSEIEDDASIYAFPVIDMAVNEDSRISTVTNSTDPTLAYLFDFSDELTSYAGAGVKIRQYTLDDNPLPNDTAFKDREIALRAGVLFSREKLVVDAFVGVAFRKLTLNSDDHELGHDKVDPAPFIGASVSYGFF
jgi:hypothetical protein